MRPNTLSEAYERIVAGVPSEKALAEFLDAFHTLPDAQARSRALASEPPLTGDGRLDALAGAAAAYLAKKYSARVPLNRMSPAAGGCCTRRGLPV
jgi:hypothetical protein